MKDRVLRRAGQLWLAREEVLSQDISRVSGEDVHLIPLLFLVRNLPRCPGVHPKELET